ncbi:hypothetical protein D3C86_1135920 [compost metagenome]
MSTKNWEDVVDKVTDRMKSYTRPFVTPLVHDPPNAPPIFGSGTYIDMTNQAGSQRRLVTCEHVIRHQPQKHRPYGSVGLEELSGVICSDRDPADAATITISDAVWRSTSHQATAVPFSSFASRHAPVDKEVMFFRGLAGENAYLGFGNLDAIVTGFCAQEPPNSGNSRFFELGWQPNATTITSGTCATEAQRVKFDNPAGFSGSLVWNTRFVELGCNLQKWSPADAMVTGLLQRWDSSTQTLLVWRAEHLYDWLTSRPSWA